MHNLGFDTWYGRVCELAKQNNLDVDGNYTKREIKLAVAETFKMHWHINLNDEMHNPILQTYTNVKAEFRMEPHLSLVTNYKYRDAITKLQASSHTLELERGRYTNPKTPLEDRLCSVCGIIEDESHFLVGCRSYARERQELKISNLFQQFQHMDNTDKFVFMICYLDPNILTAVGKFIHTCFQLRNSWQWFHFYLSQFVGFIILALSWVLISILSF